MIIMGIDPGVARMGFGVINKISGSKSKNRNEIKCLDYGLIETSPNLPMAERLEILYNELNNLIRKHKPKILAVENIYFFKNFKTAMPVSQAKGVVLLAAAKKKIPVSEEKRKATEKLFFALDETDFVQDIYSNLIV